jgi:hypothetical protein
MLSKSLGPGLTPIFNGKSKMTNSGPTHAARRFGWPPRSQSIQSGATAVKGQPWGQIRGSILVPQTTGTGAELPMRPRDRHACNCPKCVIRDHTVEPPSRWEAVIWRTFPSGEG